MATMQVPVEWTKDGKTYSTSFTIRDTALPNYITKEDDWSTILANISNGSYKKRYRISDVFSLPVDGEGDVGAQVIAMDTDGAHMIFQMFKCSNAGRRWNPGNSGNALGTGTIGGYPASEIANYIDLEYALKFPSIIQSNVIEVSKTSAGYNQSGQAQTYTSSHKFWLLSSEEFSGTKYSIGQKNKSGTSGSTAYWWLRSANNTSNARYVYYNGSLDYYNVTSEYRLAVCFCL